MALLILFAWLTTAFAETRDSLASACRVTVIPVNAVTEFMSAATPVDEDQVARWILKWQRRLKLDDWSIRGKIVGSRDLPFGSVAEIRWFIPKRTATIKVLSAKSYRLEDLEVIRETELSIVHELVHLSMARMSLGSEGTDEEEATVTRVSAALLELDTPSGAQMAGQLTQGNPTDLRSSRGRRASKSGSKSR